MTGPERAVDVISQGREPERDDRPPRLPLPRSKRWRIIAGCAAAAILAAALTVTGLQLRHDAGTGGASTAAPGSAAGAGNPGTIPGFAICSPSTQTCSVRITIIHGQAFRFTHVVKPGH
jgi:hypothetical protein